MADSSQSADWAKKMVEVRGIEPLSGKPSKQAGYMLSHSFDLISPAADRQATEETSTG